MSLLASSTIQPCDICGDVGFWEVILNCTKCVAREHCYCMKTILSSIPEQWTCDSCQPKRETPSRCKGNRNLEWQARKRQRPTGKVKFLPTDEAMKLSTGSPPSKLIPAKSNLLVTRKTSVKSKNLISRSPSLPPNSNHSNSPIALEKPPRNDGVSKKPVTYQHASHLISKGGTLSAVTEQHNIEKNDDQSIQENMNLFKFLPSSIAAWRGSFVASGNHYDGFEAHPPSTVNRKAYKFSKRMPQTLQLESLPRLDVLTDVFQNNCPDLQDIALYFFPSNENERFRKDFISMIEFMNAKESMLRSSIQGVELLVFTSNLLNTHSRGTIATAAVHVGCFLWGVFRWSKIGKATETLSNMDPLDMDVDMIGGKDIAEKIDRVVKVDRPLVRISLSSSRKEEMKAIASSNIFLQGRPPSCTKPRMKTKKLSSIPLPQNSIKKEPYPLNDPDEPPPGFEAGKVTCKSEAGGGRSKFNGT
ncbi:hypothetical protein S245_034714 [Arachis hypogaea]